jgi:Putative Actinobacterial Holin-X, holin superfamily III
MATEVHQQQLQLTRKEIDADLRKTREAASLWVAGLVTLLLSGFTGCLMLAHLIHWLASPAPADAAVIPLWVCYLIVFAVLGTAGWCLTLAGSKRFQTVHPLEGPASEGLKENVQWLTNQK